MMMICSSRFEQLGDLDWPRDVVNSANATVIL